MRRVTLTVALVLPLLLQAQTKVWTLADCTSYAVNHSLTIKQRENQRRQQQIQLSTARNARLPDLNGQAGQNWSFGRGLTAENTYTNTNTSSTSFSLGTSVPLFTGFQIPNQIKLSQLNLEAATADLEKAKNDISVQVAQAYVQTLYDMEMAEVAWRQVAIDSAQVARLQALVDGGKASLAELSQQQATLAQSRLTATQADNSRRLSLLTLTQLLELPSPDGFAIARPAVAAKAGSAEAAMPSPDAIFAEALAVKPEILAEQLRLDATKHSINLAKVGHYPTLSFSGGLGSNYYKTSGFHADNFGKQLSNNFSQYLGLSLNVPIFNRLQTRNAIRSARVERDNQQLMLDQTKKNLYKEIQQAYYNTVAAQAKYESSLAATKSADDAFTLMQAKYENGKATSTEFNEAKNNLMRSESDRVKAQYELLYQQALMRFYQGKSLNF